MVYDLKHKDMCKDSVEGIVEKAFVVQSAWCPEQTFYLVLQDNHECYKMTDFNPRVDKGEHVRVFYAKNKNGESNKIYALEILDENKDPKFTYLISTNFLETRRD